jgi:hypothetical protein
MTRGKDPARDGQVDRVDRGSEHLDRGARRFLGVPELGCGADLSNDRSSHDGAEH